MVYDKRGVRGSGGFLGEGVILYRVIGKGLTVR